MKYFCTRSLKLSERLKIFNNNNNNDDDDSNNNKNNNYYYYVLGGYSKHLEKSVRKLLGARARGVLERMQKSVISNTLNIARTFKINT